MIRPMLRKNTQQERPGWNRYVKRKKKIRAALYEIPKKMCRNDWFSLNITQRNKYFLQTKILNEIN